MRVRHVLQLLALATMLVCVYTNFGMDVRATAKSETVSHKHPGQSTGQAETLPIIVNGEQNPEAISDELAYRLFLTALAFPAAVSPEKTHARDTLLEHIGLSEEDRAAFVNGLNGLAEQLKGIELERNVVAKKPNRSAQARAEYAMLRTKRNGLITAARARIEGALTSYGFSRLDDHIQTHVKQRVKMYAE